MSYAQALEESRRRHEQTGFQPAPAPVQPSFQGQVQRAAEPFSVSTDYGDQDQVLAYEDSGNIEPVSAGSIAAQGYAPAISRKRNALAPQEATPEQESAVAFLRGSQEGKIRLIDGSEITPSELSAFKNGKELVEIAGNPGSRRNFFDASMDWGVRQVPFVGNIFGDAMSVADMLKAADTIKDVNEGRPVDKQDIVNATRLLADIQKNANATLGAKVADIVKGTFSIGLQIRLAKGLRNKATIDAGGRVNRGGVGGWIADGTAKTSTHLAKKIAGRHADELISKIVAKGIGSGARTALAEGTNLLTYEVVPNYIGSVLMGRNPYETRSFAERKVMDALAGGDSNDFVLSARDLGSQYTNYITQSAPDFIQNSLAVPFGRVARKLGRADGSMLGMISDRMFGTATERALRAKTAGAASQGMQAQIAGWFGRRGVTGDPMEAMQALRSVGYDGVIEQLLEQRMGEFLNGVFNIERDVDKNYFENIIAQTFPSPDDFLAEVIGYSIPGIAGLGLSAAQRRLNNTNVNAMNQRIADIHGMHRAHVGPVIERDNDAADGQGGTGSRFVPGTIVREGQQVINPTTGEAITPGRVMDGIEAMYADLHATDGIKNRAIRNITKGLVTGAQFILAPSLDFKAYWNEGAVDSVLFRYGIDGYMSMYDNMLQAARAAEKTTYPDKSPEEREADARSLVRTRMMRAIGENHVGKDAEKGDIEHQPLMVVSETIWDRFAEDWKRRTGETREPVAEELQEELARAAREGSPHLRQIQFGPETMMFVARDGGTFDGISDSAAVVPRMVRSLAQRMGYRQNYYELDGIPAGESMRAADRLAYADIDENMLRDAMADPFGDAGVALMSIMGLTMGKHEASDAGRIIRTEAGRVLAAIEAQREPGSDAPNVHITIPVAARSKSAERVSKLYDYDAKNEYGARMGALLQSSDPSEAAVGEHYFALSDEEKAKKIEAHAASYIISNLRAKRDNDGYWYVTVSGLTNGSLKDETSDIYMSMALDELSNVTAPVEEHIESSFYGPDGAHLRGVTVKASQSMWNLFNDKGDAGSRSLVAMRGPDGRESSRLNARPTAEALSKTTMALSFGFSPSEVGFSNLFYKNAQVIKDSPEYQDMLLAYLSRAGYAEYDPANPAPPVLDAPAIRARLIASRATDADAARLMADMQTAVNASAARAASQLEARARAHARTEARRNAAANASTADSGVPSGVPSGVVDSPGVMDAAAVAARQVQPDSVAGPAVQNVQAAMTNPQTDSDYFNSLPGYMDAREAPVGQALRHIFHVGGAFEQPGPATDYSDMMTHYVESIPGDAQPGHVDRLLTGARAIISDFESGAFQVTPEMLADPAQFSAALNSRQDDGQLFAEQFDLLIRPSTPERTAPQTNAAAAATAAADNSEAPAAETKTSPRAGKKRSSESRRKVVLKRGNEGVSAAETPAAETPAAETPAVQTSVAEASAVQAQAAETTAAQAPAVQAPAAEGSEDLSQESRQDIEERLIFAKQALRDAKRAAGGLAAISKAETEIRRLRRELQRRDYEIPPSAALGTVSASEFGKLSLSEQLKISPRTMHARARENPKAYADLLKLALNGRRTETGETPELLVRLPVIPAGSLESSEPTSDTVLAQGGPVETGTGTESGREPLSAFPSVFHLAEYLSEIDPGITGGTVTQEDADAAYARVVSDERITLDLSAPELARAMYVAALSNDSAYGALQTLSSGRKSLYQALNALRDSALPEDATKQEKQDADFLVEQYSDALALFDTLQPSFRDAVDSRDGLPENAPPTEAERALSSKAKALFDTTSENIGAENMRVLTGYSLSGKKAPDRTALETGARMYSFARGRPVSVKDNLARQKKEAGGTQTDLERANESSDNTEDPLSQNSANDLTGSSRAAFRSMLGGEHVYPIGSGPLSEAYALAYPGTTPEADLRLVAYDQAATREVIRAVLENRELRNIEGLDLETARAAENLTELARAYSGENTGYPVEAMARKLDSYLGQEAQQVRTNAYNILHTDKGFVIKVASGLEAAQHAQAASDFVAAAFSDPAKLDKLGSQFNDTLLPMYARDRRDPADPRKRVAADRPELLDAFDADLHLAAGVIYGDRFFTKGRDDAPAWLRDAWKRSGASWAYSEKSKAWFIDTRKRIDMPEGLAEPVRADGETLSNDFWSRFLYRAIAPELMKGDKSAYAKNFARFVEQFTGVSSESFLRVWSGEDAGAHRSVGAAAEFLASFFPHRLGYLAATRDNSRIVTNNAFTGVLADSVRAGAVQSASFTLGDNKFTTMNPFAAIRTESITDVPAAGMADQASKDARRKMLDNARFIPISEQALTSDELFAPLADLVAASISAPSLSGSNFYSSLTDALLRVPGNRMLAKTAESLTTHDMPTAIPIAEVQKRMDAMPGFLKSLGVPVNENQMVDQILSVGIPKARGKGLQMTDYRRAAKENALRAIVEALAHSEEGPMIPMPSLYQTNIPFGLRLERDAANPEKMRESYNNFYDSVTNAHRLLLKSKEAVAAILSTVKDRDSENIAKALMAVYHPMMAYALANDAAAFIKPAVAGSYYQALMSKDASKNPKDMPQDVKEDILRAISAVGVGRTPQINTGNFTLSPLRGKILDKNGRPRESLRVGVIDPSNRSLEGTPLESLLASSSDGAVFVRQSMLDAAREFMEGTAGYDTSGLQSAKWLFRQTRNYNLDDSDSKATVPVTEMIKANFISTELLTHEDANLGSFIQSLMDSLDVDFIALQGETVKIPGMDVFKRAHAFADAGRTGDAGLANLKAQFGENAVSLPDAGRIQAAFLDFSFDDGYVASSLNTESSLEESPMIRQVFSAISLVRGETQEEVARAMSGVFSGLANLDGRVLEKELRRRIADSVRKDGGEYAESLANDIETGREALWMINMRGDLPIKSAADEVTNPQQAKNLGVAIPAMSPEMNARLSGYGNGESYADMNISGDGVEYSIPTGVISKDLSESVRRERAIDEWNDKLRGKLARALRTASDRTELYLTELDRKIGALEKASPLPGTPAFAAKELYIARLKALALHSGKMDALLQEFMRTDLPPTPGTLKNFIIKSLESLQALNANGVRVAIPAWSVLASDLNNSKNPADNILAIPDSKFNSRGGYVPQDGAIRMNPDGTASLFFARAFVVRVPYTDVNLGTSAWLDGRVSDANSGYARLASKDVKRKDADYDGDMFHGYIPQYSNAEHDVTVALLRAYDTPAVKEKQNESLTELHESFANSARRIISRLRSENPGQEMFRPFATREADLDSFVENYTASIEREGMIGVSIASAQAGKRANEIGVGTTAKAPVALRINNTDMRFEIGGSGMDMNSSAQRRRMAMLYNIPGSMIPQAVVDDAKKQLLELLGISTKEHIAMFSLMMMSAPEMWNFARTGKAFINGVEVKGAGMSEKEKLNALVNDRLEKTLRAFFNNSVFDESVRDYFSGNHDTLEAAMRSKAVDLAVLISGDKLAGAEYTRAKTDLRGLLDLLYVSQVANDQRLYSGVNHAFAGQPHSFKPSGMLAALAAVSDATVTGKRQHGVLSKEAAALLANARQNFGRNALRGRKSSRIFEDLSSRLGNQSADVFGPAYRELMRNPGASYGKRVSDAGTSPGPIPEVRAASVNTSNGLAGSLAQLAKTEYVYGNLLSPMLYGMESISNWNDAKPRMSVAHSLPLVSGAAFALANSDHADSARAPITRKSLSELRRAHPGNMFVRNLDVEELRDGENNIQVHKPVLRRLAKRLPSDDTIAGMRRAFLALPEPIQLRILTHAASYTDARMARNQADIWKAVPFSEEALRPGSPLHDFKRGADLMHEAASYAKPYDALNLVGNAGMEGIAISAPDVTAPVEEVDAFNKAATDSALARMSEVFKELGIQHGEFSLFSQGNPLSSRISERVRDAARAAIDGDAFADSRGVSGVFSGMSEYELAHHDALTNLGIHDSTQYLAAVANRDLFREAVKLSKSKESRDALSRFLTRGSAQEKKNENQAGVRVDDSVVESIASGQAQSGAQRQNLVDNDAAQALREDSFKQMSLFDVGLDEVEGPGSELEESLRNDPGFNKSAPSAALGTVYAGSVGILSTNTGDSAFQKASYDSGVAQRVIEGMTSRWASQIGNIFGDEGWITDMKVRDVGEFEGVSGVRPAGAVTYVDDPGLLGRRKTEVPADFAQLANLYLQAIAYSAEYDSIADAVASPQAWIPIGIDPAAATLKTISNILPTRVLAPDGKTSFAERVQEIRDSSWKAALELARAKALAAGETARVEHDEFIRLFENALIDAKMGVRIGLGDIAHASLDAREDAGRVVLFIPVKEGLKAFSNTGTDGLGSAKEFLLEHGRTKEMLDAQKTLESFRKILDATREAANKLYPDRDRDGEHYLRFLPNYVPHFKGHGFLGNMRDAVSQRMEDLSREALANFDQKALARKLSPVDSTGINRNVQAAGDEIFKMLHELGFVNLNDPDAKIPASGEAARYQLSTGVTFTDSKGRGFSIDNESTIYDLMKIAEEIYSYEARNDTRRAMGFETQAAQDGLDAGSKAAFLHEASVLLKDAEEKLMKRGALSTVVRDYYSDETTNRAKYRPDWNFTDRALYSGVLPSNTHAGDYVRMYGQSLAQAIKTRIGVRRMAEASDSSGLPVALFIPSKNVDALARDAMFDMAHYERVASGIKMLTGEARKPGEGATNYIRRVADEVLSLNTTDWQQVVSNIPSIERVFVRRRSDVELLTKLTKSDSEAAGYIKNIVGLPWRDKSGMLDEAANLNMWMKGFNMFMSYFFKVAASEGYVSQIGDFKQAMQLPFGRGKDYLDMNALLQSQDANMDEFADWALRMGLRFNTAQLNVAGVSENDMTRNGEAFAKRVGRIFGKNAEDGARWLMNQPVRSQQNLFGGFFNNIKLLSAYKMLQQVKQAKREQIKKAWLKNQGIDLTKAQVDRLMPTDSEIFRPYAEYVNSEVGGINWDLYPYMTPTVRKYSSLLLLSWDWTASAWQAGGGSQITSWFGGKDMMTPEEYSFIFGKRWPRMIAYVGIAVPAATQILATLAGAALGTLDEDDTFLMFNNEGERETYADITPVMRAMPWYRGGATGSRRVFIHWGKQGYEVLNWFEDPAKAFIGKMSPVARTSLELLTGTSGTDYTLPFKEEGLSGWFRGNDGEFSSGRIAHAAKAFLPFSATGMMNVTDAAPLGIIGPVLKGKPERYRKDQAVERIQQAIKNGAASGDRNFAQRAAADVLEDARRNGYDPERMLTSALAEVRTPLYSGLFKALRSGNEREAKVWIKRLQDTGATASNMLNSIKSRSADSLNSKNSRHREQAQTAVNLANELLQ